MDKKASGNIWMPIMGVCAIALVAILGLAYFSPETIMGEEQQTQQVIQTAQATKVGDSASLKIACKDAESDTNSQAASDLFVWDKDNKILIEDGTDTTTSARTSVATKVGANLQIWCGNNTYYSDLVDHTVASETEHLDIPVHKIAKLLDARLYYDGAEAKNLSNGAGFNYGMLLAASESDAFDYIKIKQNNSNSAYNLYMIGVDLAASSNIQDVTINGMTETNEVPSNIRTKADYIFKLDSALTLHEFDTWKSGTVVYEADGTGANENTSLILVDWTCYSSSVDDSIKCGVEDDQGTPADIGAGNLTIGVEFSNAVTPT